MCGRFTLTIEPGQLQSAFPWVEFPDDLKPRYNIAPSQPIGVVSNNGLNQFEFYIWGLIPSWAKAGRSVNGFINARAETLAEKPTFRAPFRKRRCLILADGFYEWKADPSGKSKTPYYIKLKSGNPFVFAGLWDSWKDKEGSEIRSCAIITTEPNQLMQTIHNRMPVILASEHYEQWLSSGDGNPDLLSNYLKPYPAEKMVAFPVSKAVNSPQNDTPECIRPLTW
jgi:putative SOS response-associated peptidase YedK